MQTLQKKFQNSLPNFASRFRNRLSTHCVNTQYPCLNLCAFLRQSEKKFFKVWEAIFFSMFFSILQKTGQSTLK